MHLIPKQTWVDRIYHTAFVSIIFPSLFHLSSDTMILLLCNFTFCKIIHFTLLQFCTEKIGICTKHTMKFHSHKLTKTASSIYEKKMCNFLFRFTISILKSTKLQNLKEIRQISRMSENKNGMYLNFSYCMHAYFITYHGNCLIHK